MDESGMPSSAEELVRAMLDLFRKGAVQEEAALATAGPLPDNPRGFLASIEEWGARHPEAAAGLTKAVVSDSSDALDALPLKPLLLDLAETLLAFGAAEKDLNEFLHLRAPRVTTGFDGTMKWALLTPITDSAALIREIVGRRSARPHRRSESPSIDLHLTEAHHADELRRAYGLSLRQALTIDERSTPERAEVLFRPLISSMTTSSLGLGRGIEWLLRNQPQALLTMPTTLGVTDALQGNTVPREEMRLHFVHVVEPEGLGFCAFLMWDTSRRLTTRQRTEVAGHIRHVSDTAVAPWNRYADLRRRREAFAVWVRKLREETVDARGLATVLRRQYPDSYRHEPLKKTVKRIYRISTQLSDIRLPLGLMKLLREDGQDAASAR